MSDIGDVLSAIKALIDDLDALLKTDTAKQGPEIAKTLNVQDQFKDGVSKTRDALIKVEQGLEPVRRVAVIADALGAVFGMVPPFISALGDAAQDTGGYLATLNIGLDGAASVAKDIDGPLKTVANLIDVADNTAESLLAFVDPSRLTGIVDSLKTLVKDLDTLRQDPPGALSSGSSSSSSSTAMSVLAKP